MPRALKLPRVIWKARGISDQNSTSVEVPGVQDNDIWGIRRYALGYTRAYVPKFPRQRVYVSICPISVVRHWRAVQPYQRLGHWNPSAPPSTSIHRLERCPSCIELAGEMKMKRHVKFEAVKHVPPECNDVVAKRPPAINNLHPGTDGIQLQSPC
jgi:hypothetical protein